MKPATFHPEASQEYFEAVGYYCAIDSGLGIRFDAEIQRLVEAIGRDPKRFSRFNPPVQRALCRQFPYSIIYLEQADRIWIVAVMHAKRHPSYWKKRLK